MPSLADKPSAPQAVPADLPLPPGFPELPDDVLKRFPSLEDWASEVDSFWTKARAAMDTANTTISNTTTVVNQASQNLRVSINGLTLAITDETTARIDANEAIAKRIVTVSAIAGVSSNITVSGVAPGAPVLNDLWVDNTDPLTPVTKRWDGAAWVEVTTPISAAAVATEQSARITADGFLAGKYTLTVIAGDVVTGMNITSSTGGGTNVSSVIFRATDFKIYNGVTGIVMFDVSATDVRLAATLVVSTSGKVYIGTGTYGNINTAFYVDSTGQMSLKDKFTWNGTTLTITGTIVGSDIIVTTAVGMRYTNDAGVFTITGGSANGVTHGAQIDLAGTSVGGGIDGVLVLSAGNHANGSIFLRTGAAVNRLTITNAGAATFSGSLAVTGAWACNGAAPQTPYASGGVLANVVTALIANGILSS